MKTVIVATRICLLCLFSFLVLFAPEFLGHRPCGAAIRVSMKADDEPQFVDLSLLVAQDMPCTWPSGFPQFQINPYLRIGPASAYNSDI